MPVVQTERFSVDYGRQRGVHPLDLSIDAGEKYGFLGPHGAGKTTARRVLRDSELESTAGHASVFGMDSQKHGVIIHKWDGYLLV